jgi:flagellar basal-body rod protein FlgC
MISALHTTLSSLLAFARQLHSSAHNLANVNTDSFKRSETTLIEAPNGGVLPILQKDNSPGPTVLRNSPQGLIEVELSNTDIGTEIITSVIVQRAFEANIQTIKTADTMLGGLLDLRK